VEKPAGKDLEHWNARMKPVAHSAWRLTLIVCVAASCVWEVHAAANKAILFPAIEPEKAGMDRAKLEEAKRYALTGGGSGCILRGGRLVMKWGDQKRKYDIYSSTKSISVTALGLAIMDGKVKLHDKARRHLPSVGTPPESNAQTGWLDELTLWHLATQTGGFEKTRGWCQQLHRPGTAWMYSDGGPNWLADCLTTAYGRDLLEVMNERVFEPLAISVGETSRGGEHDLHWGFNDLDRPRQIQGLNRRPFGAGIHCNVEAMAKLGSLYLQRGRWRGKQILPETFVSLATGQAEGIDQLPVKDDLPWSAGASRHYGLLWWNNHDGTIQGVPRDAFWSWGMKESFIVVIPSLDIVAVRAGDYWAPGNDARRKDVYNNVVKPFLRPVCESVARRGPYSQSACIPRVTFSDLILDKHLRGPAYASGDQWAGTWADDGHLYMGWGDGTGFGYRGGWNDPATAFIGLARIEGMPPDHRGMNVWGGFQPESRAGAHYAHQQPRSMDLKPADGLIFINGTLYWYAERKSDGRIDCQLLTSTDHGRNWRDHGRFFQENGRFAFTGIIQCGQNYSAAPDHLGPYLHLFDGGTKAENQPHFQRKDMLLARIPLTNLLNRGAVEFLHVVFESAEQERRAQHKQGVGDNRPGDRRLHKHILAGPQGGECDDQFRQVSQGGVEQAADGITGFGRHRFGGMTQQRSQGHDGQDGQPEEQGVRLGIEVRGLRGPQAPRPATIGASCDGFRSEVVS